MTAANIDDTQRLSILAACVSKMSVSGDADSTTKNAVFIQNISYSTIADVLRQGESSDVGRSLGASSAHASLSHSNNHFDGRGGRGRYRHNGVQNDRKDREPCVRRTPEEIAVMKGENPCHLCKTFSHWSNAHNDGGTLKSGTTCHITAVDAKAALTCSGECSMKPMGNAKTRKSVSLHQYLRAILKLIRLYWIPVCLKQLLDMILSCALFQSILDLMQSKLVNWLIVVHPTAQLEKPIFLLFNDDLWKEKLSSCRFLPRSLVSDTGSMEMAHMLASIDEFLNALYCISP